MGNLKKKKKVWMFIFSQNLCGLFQIVSHHPC